MVPQETVSAGSPIPKKLRVDSVPMAEPILVTTINKMEEKNPGAK